MLTNAKGAIRMLEFVRIRIGHGAQPTCSLCSPSAAESHIPATEVAAALSEAVARVPEGHALNVILEGSEPFRHPELPVIISECVAARAARIGIETDAGAFTIDENAHGALSAGLRQIHVPLFGADGATHDRLRPGAGFARSCAGAKNFLTAADHAGLPALLVGVLPVCAHNIDHAAATVALFARLGAVAVRVVPGAVRADDPRLGAAYETGMTNGVWVWADGAEASFSLAAHTRAAFSVVEVGL